MKERATTAQISMAKRNNVDMVIHRPRSKTNFRCNGNIRRIPIMHHMMNLESTYEGTHDIHLQNNITKSALNRNKSIAVFKK
jgi:glutaryl-CoA dehydrogenase